MKAKIYEWILRSFIRLPHSILETIFTICYPIYAMLHTEKAWKRVLLHLRHAGFPEGTESGGHDIIISIPQSSTYKSAEINIRAYIYIKDFITL